MRIFFNDRILQKSTTRENVVRITKCIRLNFELNTLDGTRINWTI